MQSETLIPQAVDLLIHGGNAGFMGVAIYVLVRVLKRLNRDESLHKDYPPHRHINGTRIVYPSEFQPTPIERLDGQV